MAKKAAPQANRQTVFSSFVCDAQGVCEFPDLMGRRVEEILLVSTMYDLYILEQDGLLSELIYSEYVDLGLSNAPRVTRVARGDDALAQLKERKFDLVISMLRVGDMDVADFVHEARAIRDDMPIALLVPNIAELNRIGDRRDELGVDDIFLWQGDARILLAMIKIYEDRWNAPADTALGDVGTIIVVEDSVRFLSVLLPQLYSELVKQTRAVMREGLNRMQKLMRLRARPKIQIAASYEEALGLFEQYKSTLFGVIADVRFPRKDEHHPSAGLDFIQHVHRELPDVPALLQSSEIGNRALAQSIGVSFLHKQSDTLLQDLRRFILENFGFGDFVFRMPDRREVGRAHDLHSMVRVLAEVPDESIRYHATRNHFSNWLRARSEFALARTVRPLRADDFGDTQGLREYLVIAFREAIRNNRRGTIEDFSPQRFDGETSFARVGGGSLGGKARGLAFFDAMLLRSRIESEFEDLRIFVPTSVVIGTDCFDRFLELNDLQTTTLYEASDEWIIKRFLDAHLPNDVLYDLSAFLREIRTPIAVRSSSILEDSQYHPFAGVFQTYMLPNNHPDDNVRLSQLVCAIQHVYASGFSVDARRYMAASSLRAEEQKMAVVLQPVIGTRRDDYFYPDFAGVVRSYNFYPFGQIKPEDGVANVCLGLGQVIMDGGESLRFSPSHPHVIPEMAHGKEFLDRAQRRFCAINVGKPRDATPDLEHRAIELLDLDVAEKHGTLNAVGSVWDPENQAFYDGIHRAGVRTVTFAHVLKSGIFPLADVLKRILELGRESMSVPVELEFAVNLNTEPKEFAVLQIRPFTAAADLEPVNCDDFARDATLVNSTMAMGNGVVDGVQNVIYVRPEKFDAAKTTQIAAEVRQLNEQLAGSDEHCILIGPGRWGSSNSWLGIPVTWSHITTARVIIETSLEDFIVDPSQGSHFFHNLTSMGVAYMTVNAGLRCGFVDWKWLEKQPVRDETDYVRLVRLAEPLEVRVDGRSSHGVILKAATRVAATFA